MEASWSSPCPEDDCTPAEAHDAAGGPQLTDPRLLARRDDRAVHAGALPPPAILAGGLSRLSDEAQDSDGQRGGRDDGADHPTDESGFKGLRSRSARRRPPSRAEYRDQLSRVSHLGEAGLELVGGDAVAVLEAVVDRLGDDFGLVAVDAASS